MHCLTDHYFMYILIHLIQDFEKDFSSFQENVADFDRRLSSILCLAFQDCSGLESVFKVSNSDELV